MSKPLPEVPRTMEGKVCLVTGATAGIGLVTARELARRGARVIGVGRSRERCEAMVDQIKGVAPAGSIEYLIADLSSQREIRRLADEVKAATDRLHVLVNNAGGIFPGRRVTDDGLEYTFALNHLSYFLLTTLLLDLLKASAPSRIICVASSAHRGARLDFDDLQGERRYHFWPAYQRSKLANILFARELSRRLEGTGVTVNALHPGYVNTQIFRVQGPMGWLLRRSADLFAISPEQGARTTVHLATSPEVEGVTGQYFCREKIAGSSQASLDDQAARQLWEASEALISSPGH